MDRANLAIRMRGLEPGELGVSCHDCSQFVPNSDATILGLVGCLQRFAESVGATGGIDTLEEERGFNHRLGGLLQDRALHGSHPPTQHHCRDWGRVMVQDGVANTEVGLLIHRLEAINISTQMLQSLFTCVCANMPLQNQHRTDRGSQNQKKHNVCITESVFVY